MAETIVVTAKKTKITILILLVALAALLHFLVPTESHSYHKVHIVLRKLYFLPPVIAAAWFGLRGAVFTTSAVSILFTIHAYIDWPGNYMEQANQIGELAGFWIVGLVPGWLFDRQRSLLAELARANEDTLLALVSALDLRERKTRLHSQQVREYTRLLADQFGLDEKSKRVIGFGALLHDVGKIAISDHILLKPGSLTDEELREMRKHPASGYRILKQFRFLSEAAEIVYAHHEHYDGSGYPRGLRGEDIPVGARLFMVVDVYDALTSERPYHAPAGHDEAVKVITQKIGSHFDPAAVEAFFMIDPARLKNIKERFSEKSGKELQETV